MSVPLGRVFTAKADRGHGDRMERGKLYGLQKASEPKGQPERLGAD